jgi:hypothetical protein
MIHLYKAGGVIVSEADYGLKFCDDDDWEWIKINSEQGARQ